MVGDSPLRFWDPPGSPFTAIRLAMQPYGCKCAPWLSIVALVDCSKWLLVLNVLDCRRILCEDAFEMCISVIIPPDILHPSKQPPPILSPFYQSNGLPVEMGLAISGRLVTQSSR